MTPAEILRRKAAVYASDTTEFYGGPDVAAELEHVAKEIEEAAATTDLRTLSEQMYDALRDDPLIVQHLPNIQRSVDLCAKVVAQRQVRGVARPDDDKWLELSRHWEQYWRKSYEANAAQVLESWYYLKDILASNESTDDDRNKAWGDLEKDIEKLPSLDAPASASELAYTKELPAVDGAYWVRHIETNYVQIWQDVTYFYTAKIQQSGVGTKSCDVEYLRSLYQSQCENNNVTPYEFCYIPEPKAK